MGRVRFIHLKASAIKTPIYLQQQGRTLPTAGQQEKILVEPKRGASFGDTIVDAGLNLSHCEFCRRE